MKVFHPHLIDRRLRVARLAVWVTAIVLVLAFFRAQILGHGKYQLQSETNRLRPIPLPAPRGLIYDRHGQVIAENVPGYTVALLPGPEGSLRATLWRIASLVRLDSAAMERILARYRRAPYQPALVLPDAPFEIVSALEERRLTIPGLIIQTEPKRSYPDSTIAAHLVGYVGEVTEGERNTTRWAAVRLGGLVGKDGLEREYDDSLRGKDGVRFVEVSALGRMVREGGAAPTLDPIPGAPLHTSIDLDLQRFIAKRFPAGQRGAVVALNPNSGEILALYSAPGYDPNAFVGGVDPDYWRGLNENEAHPLLDRAIQARYPPGSTWKLGVAAMALKRGIVTFRTRMPIPCRGGLQYGNRFFRCWNAEGHGALTLSEAIAQSCDVYFYQLGLKLGLTSLLEDANEWGFRTRTNIDLPGEIPPEFPSGPEYYDRLYGPRRWTSAVSLNLAIGQGENAQTLVSMVRMYQMVAGDGRSRTPYVVRPVGAVPATTFDLGPDQLEGLRQALLAVVEQGTARGSRLRSLTIAGKTATAQNPHGPDHGWFIGFAPAEKPEIVVGAIIEFAQHGAAVAPLVTRIIARYLGADSIVADIRLLLPADTAPQSQQLLPGLAPRDSTSIDTIRTDTTRGVPPPRNR
ncbi:MAG: penicillin-binding protein 2 [Gemmatimonadetes bacterium]|nr:penicillin-binding protein 2 [Gemmatimonadota bacterium]